MVDASDFGRDAVKIDNMAHTDRPGQGKTMVVRRIKGERIEVGIYPTWKDRFGGPGPYGAGIDAHVTIRADHGELDNLIELIERAREIVEADIEESRELTEFDLDIIQWVGINGPAMIENIAFFLKTSTSAVSRAVNVMDPVWIERKRVDGGRSEDKIYLTENGKTKFKQLDEERIDARK